MKNTAKFSSFSKKIAGWAAMPALILFLLFLFINGRMMSGSINRYFIEGFLSTNAPAICIAIGVSAAILSGGIDISLGAIVSMVNVIIVWLCESLGLNVFAAAIIGLVIGLLAGVFNGLVIAVLRVTPLLATFASSAIFSGIALWIRPYPGGSIPGELNSFYNSRIFNVIPMPLIVLLLPLAVFLVLKKTPIGTYVYAIGKDEKKAYASAVNLTKVKLLVYTFAGFAAGVAGVAMSASISAGDPLAGNMMGMTSIAAAVIGGISLSGGKGDVWGAVFGSMFLSILISTVVSANINSFMQSLVNGLILLVALILAVFIGNRGEILAMHKKIKKPTRGVQNGQ
jgi:ribose transport system permease protein